MLTHRQLNIRHLQAMKIGHKIKTARTEAGFTQRTLALALDVSDGLVGAWESHKKAPGRDNLVKLARVVGRPLSYFIEDTTPDLAVLETKNPEEIELVGLYRAMSVRQRATHLDLFRESAALRAEIEAQRDPTNRKKITA